MRKFFCAILLLSSICIMDSCSSGGAYDANPSSPANQSVNPLNPLKASQFTWSGSGKFSANINGSPWVADTAYVYLSSGGVGNIYAQQYSTGTSFIIHYPNSYAGNLYNMGFGQDRYAIFTDSLGSYYSTLGNSGELNVTLTGSDTLQAKFYFQGINSTDSNLINVNDGFINIVPN
jgi:hypothetical protein